MNIEVLYDLENFEKMSKSCAAKLLQLADINYTYQCQTHRKQQRTTRLKISSYNIYVYSI